jgi:undecaprenyl-diphosphatase
LNPFYAALLGIVEGITEYLPVSSTGHLIMAARALGFAEDDEGLKAFEVVIQLGAILAVLIQYRALLAERTRGLFTRDKRSVGLLLALGFGFAPTALAGLLLRHTIKEKLFGTWPVAAALLVGGVLMIIVESARGKKERGLVGLEHVTPLRGFLIGVGQCVALWPGSSRSMCTIMAGQATGLSTATAAEFSFLLGLPTLGAATLYEGYKSRVVLAHLGGLNVLIGLVVSFVVAWAVIAGFIAYLKRRGLLPFGVYRVLVGGVTLVLLLEHVIH